MFRTRIGIRDLIVAIGVCLLACLLLFSPLLWRERGTTLLISTPSGTKEYTLAENREIEVISGEYTLCIEICDGAARVRESNCPDGVCLATPSVSRAGESVICAPAGVRLQVKGGDSNVDFVAG